LLMMPNSSTMPIWIRLGLGFESDFVECKKRILCVYERKMGFDILSRNQKGILMSSGKCSSFGVHGLGS
jgi:hypothetical protein